MKHPQLIALTGTMPNDYLPILSSLLTIKSFTSNSLVCGSPTDFSQSEIEMRSYITLKQGQYVSKGLCELTKFLLENPSSSAVLFYNSQKQSQHYRNNLERKLYEMKLNVYVININGLLHKVDKFWRIHLFCDKTHIREADFIVLVTTNAANVGIDKHSIAIQMQIEWPKDPLTYFQERGIGSRKVGTRSTCILYADLSSYVFLVTQTGKDNTSWDEPDRTNEDGRYNYAISPRRQIWLVNNSQFNFPLGPAASRQLRVCTLDKLHQVVIFFCLNLGCQHVRGEVYLSTGLLDAVPATGKCTSCLICTHSYHKDFLPVF
jgi:hypothetical protein